MVFELNTLSLILLGVVATLALILWRAVSAGRVAAARAQHSLFDSQADARIATERLAAVERNLLQAQGGTSALRDRLSEAETRGAVLQSTLDDLKPRAEADARARAEAVSELERARARAANVAKDLEILRTQASSAGSRVEQLAAELAAAQARNRQQHERELEFTGANTLLTAEVANSSREIARMQAWVNESAETLRAQMVEIASKVINDSTTQFRAQSKEQLELMLKPFDKDLSAFREKIEQLYLDETKERTSLQGEVRRLAEASSRVSQDAQTLALALRGDSRSRGNWGEVVLGRVLEMSGLREGHEYFRQHHVADDDSGSGRLDILVKLPQDRCVVIDSKVSLVAYDRYVNATAEEDTGAFVKAHMESLRSHVKDLAGKEYAKRFGEQAIEYVLLFVPIEPALMLALQHDAELQGFAHDRNIVLVSPNTLMAMLKTIDYLWRVEKRTHNSEEIARRAGKLIDSIAQSGALLADLRRQLGTVDNTLRKIDDRFTGRQGLVTHARLMQELGAKGSRTLPVVGHDDDLAGDAEVVPAPDPASLHANLPAGERVAPERDH